MSNTWDISRLSPVERTYEVANRYGGNSDQFVLAAAGLDRLRQKDQRRQFDIRSNRSIKFVVERLLTTTVNGRTMETRVYLSDRLASGTLSRSWGGPETAKTFKGKRDAERALMNKNDPAARIIPLTEMVVRSDQLAAGGAL
jgi:hypothetical protein